MRYLDTVRIQAFVDRVERRKRFRRDPNLILRHLLEELGECSNRLWLYESATPRLREKYRAEVGREIVDMVSLCVYLADVLKIDLNAAYPKRIEEVFRQYNVERRTRE